jgi:hypothetical protein
MQASEADMQYVTSIAIDLPRTRVIELFDDADNLPKWQRGLLSFEPISGEPGSVGSRSRLVFQMGKRQMEMIETITRRDLPDAFDGTYDIEGTHNIVQNRFYEVGPNQTLWESHNVFEFGSWPMKLIGLVFPGMFKAQSMKYAEDFKAFAERGVVVRQAAK